MYLCRKRLFHALILIVGLAVLIEFVNSDSQINPYKVLGLSKNANEKQIRNAYKKLAKDWHPDRNKSPEAAEKFMQINQAYEILSDEERRNMYDQYGTTSEPKQGGQHGGGFHRENYEEFFQHSGFNNFFGGGGFKFNFNNGQNRKSSEEEINKKIYEEIIVPNSYVKPFLIYSYTEFCMMCMTVESTWEQLKQEVKNIGFGAGHSDASWNRELSKTLGISTVPSIVGIVNFKVYHFSGEYNLKNLREFVRKLIPAKLITEVNYQNFNQTLRETIDENKVFALFASHSNQLTLRYQMPCLQMTVNIKCASIKLNSVDSTFSQYLIDSYNIYLPSVSDKQEIFLLFKENLSLNKNKEHKPVHQQYSNEISFASILQTFETNKFLSLPRLSSSQFYFDLCSSWSLAQTDFDTNVKLICVIFITQKWLKPEASSFFNAEFRMKLIRKVANDNYMKQTAQFTYVYFDVQSDFIEKITKNSKLKPIESDNNNKSLFENKVVLLKRLNDKYAQFDIFDLEMQKTTEQIVDSIKELINTITIGTRKLSFKMPTPEFYDESSPNIFRAIFDYIEEVWSYVSSRFFWENLLSNSSYMMIILCTVLFVWLMMMFSYDKSNPNALNQHKKDSSTAAAATNNRQKYQNKQNESRSMNHSASTNDLSSENLEESVPLSQSRTDLNDLKEFKCDGVNLAEMTTQNYEALVRCLPNGFRTILLIVTKDRKSKLIGKFSQICSNFNNKSYHLRFAYLNADTPSGQKWINDLCAQSYKEMDPNEANNVINANDVDDDTEDEEENFIDFKKNYIVLGINQQRKYYLVFNVAKKILNFRCRDEDNIYDSSLGFSSELEDKFESGLANWLDKLTEGLNMNFKKYHVKKWPAF